MKFLGKLIDIQEYKEKTTWSTVELNVENFLYRERESEENLY